MSIATRESAIVEGESGEILTTMHLTNTGPDFCLAEVACGEGDESPDAEIEITPEMMKAGVRAFDGYDIRDMEPERAVESIYCATEAYRIRSCRN